MAAASRIVFLLVLFTLLAGCVQQGADVRRDQIASPSPAPLPLGDSVPLEACGIGNVSFQKEHPFGAPISYVSRAKPDFFNTTPSCGGVEVRVVFRPDHFQGVGIDPPSPSGQVSVKVVGPQGVCATFAPDGLIVTGTESAKSARCPGVSAGQIQYEGSGQVYANVTIYAQRARA